MKKHIYITALTLIIVGFTACEFEQIKPSDINSITGPLDTAFNNSKAPFYFVGNVNGKTTKFGGSDDWYATTYMGGGTVNSLPYRRAAFHSYGRYTSENYNENELVTFQIGIICNQSSSQYIPKAKFYNYFKLGPGVFNFGSLNSTNPSNTSVTTTNTVYMAYQDVDGYTWKTTGPQDNGSFEITDTLQYPSQMSDAYTIRFRAKVNCTLYKGSESITVKDGILIGVCFVEHP